MLRFALLTLLIGCGDPEEPLEPEEPAEPICIESLFCCEYTCTTQTVIDERGPDPCDCDGEPEPPTGNCDAVDGACQFVE